MDTSISGFMVSRLKIFYTCKWCYLQALSIDINYMYFGNFNKFAPQPRSGNGRTVGSADVHDLVDFDETALQKILQELIVRRLLDAGEISYVVVA